MKKSIMTMLGILVVLASSLAFADSCPTLATNWSFTNYYVRQDNVAAPNTTFYESIFTGYSTGEQFGPDNCLIKGYITIEHIYGPDGINVTNDPAFQGATLPLQVPFTGSMTYEGKTIKMSITVTQNWHEYGILTNFDRASKTYKGMDYIIMDIGASGKGTATATTSP